MPAGSSARLPIPHLFMVLSIGFFVVMMVSAFAPAAADGGVSPAAAPGSAPAEMSARSTGCTGGATVGDASCAVGMTMAAPVEPAVPAVDGLMVGSLVALLALLAVTVGAGRAGAHGSGRPILGLVAGLLAGLAGAASLFSMGAITLSSPTWIYGPLVLSTLGTALGTTAPLPRP